MMQKVDLKIVLLGKENGGKTSLVQRFLYDRFQEGSTSSTIGVSFGAKTITLQSNKVKQSLTLGIWDTAGSERFESMTKQYYRNAKAVVLVYDITDPQSFEKLKFWAKELEENRQNEPLIYICGTKADLIPHIEIERNSNIKSKYNSIRSSGDLMKKVPFYQVEKFASEIGAVWCVEISNKTGQAVDALFERIARDYLIHQSGSSRMQFEVDDTSVRLEHSRKERCCF